MPWVTVTLGVVPKRVVVQDNVSVTVNGEVPAGGVIVSELPLPVTVQAGVQLAVTVAFVAETVTALPVPVPVAVAFAMNVQVLPVQLTLPTSAMAGAGAFAAQKMPITAMSATGKSFSAKFLFKAKCYLLGAQTPL